MTGTKTHRTLFPDAHPIVMWEFTRACDLHCANCTIAETAFSELTTYEAYKTIDQIASLLPREVIITGGDPMERRDVAQVVDYARRRGLDPALVVSSTSHVTADAVAWLKHSGLTRIILNIDGATSDIHDAVRGVEGTFESTLRAMQIAKDSGLAVEVNTLITRKNLGDLSGIVDLIRPAGIARWNLYFQVPLAGRGADEMLNAGQTEALFSTIETIGESERFAVRVFEAPHYRRYRLQHELDYLGDAARWPDFALEETHLGAQSDLMNSAVDGARGFVFISHSGDVRPSEFVPFSAGNVRYRDLGAVYRRSDLFVALRDLDNMLGRCGHCEFNLICGGSRARAWAMGDIFGDDPSCAYQPGSGIPLPTATLKHLEAIS